MFLKKILWTLPFICFLAGYLLLTKIYPVKDIETPNIVGKTLQHACSILAQHNLNSRLINLKVDPLLAQGTIICQTPQAGQKIKPNQAVFIVASTQPEKNCAPNLILKSVHEIDPELSLKGIRFKSYPLPSNHPTDTCVAQWPEPGVPLENNKMIVYVSQNIIKPILLANLKNKTVPEVLDFLAAHSMTVDIQHDSGVEDTHHCSSCIVIDQRPLASSIITLDPKKPLRVQLRVAPKE